MNDAPKPWHTTKELHAGQRLEKSPGEITLQFETNVAYSFRGLRTRLYTKRAPTKNLKLPPSPPQ